MLVVDYFQLLHRKPLINLYIPGNVYLEDYEMFVKFLNFLQAKVDSLNATLYCNTV